MRNIEIFPLQSDRIIDWGDSVVERLITVISKGLYQLLEGDIVVVTSKVISMEEKARVKIDEVTPSEKALELAISSKLDPKVVEIILQQSEEIYGAVFHAILTKTGDGLSANAGVDLSNSPEGYALLLPSDPDNSARKIRSALQNRFGVSNLGVIITDSRTIPMKRGTMAVALGVAGFNPLIDDRGKKDLYNYTMAITTRAVADNVATAANLVMGESSERIPFAIVRGVTTTSNEKVSMKDTLMPETECLYFGPLLKLSNRET